MGVKGYNHPGRKHKVVAVNPDGSVAEVFEFIKDAVRKYGMDRHSITNSCRRGSICHGWKWFYEEDFRRIYMNCEYERLRFTLDPNRDPVTYQLKKGHKLGNGYERKSEETRKKMSDVARKNCLRRAADGRYKESARKNYKPVVCLTDGMEFPSIKHAAVFYNIPPGAISSCIHRIGTTRGLRIRLKSHLVNIKEVI